jgi:hypothetical protein
MANRGGFSWKRAVGITNAKRKISKTTGIPLTKSGRQRKVGAVMTGGGCMIPIVSLLGIVTMIIMFFI